MKGTSMKVRLIVIFGDISGFSDFVDSVTNDAIEYDPLMDKFDDLLDQMARETGYSFVDTGDGFMCTVDLLPGHNCTTAVKVILNLWKLLKQIERAIEDHRKNSLAPDGIRFVASVGYGKRKIKKDGAIILRGKHINWAHNSLDLARGLGFVCDNAFKQLINDEQAKKHGITFERMKRPKRHRIWIVRVEK